jgi:hypothetical protein
MVGSHWHLLGSWELFYCCSPRQHKRQSWLLGLMCVGGLHMVTENTHVDAFG